MSSPVPNIETKFKVDTQKFVSFFRNSWFVPSFYEFFTFAMLVTLFVLLIIFFHYSSIQRTVKKTSRCLKDRQKNSVSGIYTVTATNSRREPMFKVAYNLSGKQQSVQCACPEGKFTNTFTDIKVYNLKNNTVDTIPEKFCQCDTDVQPDDPSRVYYAGYPGLVRFMNSNGSDTSFFTSSLQ